LRPRRQIVQLVGREVPALPAADGNLRAENDSKPASAKSVQYYIARAFGDRLLEVRAATKTLVASFAPEDESVV
jgi:hypothetical protein